MTKTRSISIMFISLLATASVQAQLYKSVGPDGKITYSDTPPPATQKLLGKKALNESEQTVNLPYELSLAVSKNPVVIYTANRCAPCDDGRKMLKSSGIPFSEKTVKTDPDLEKLRQISGDTQLPFLSVGSQKLYGFNAEEWKAALNKAAYPSNNLLPGDYRYPAAESAAPAENTAKSEKNTVPSAKPATPPVSQPNVNNGFRF